MKSIVIYFSLTGSTKKVARAIEEGMRPLVAVSRIVTLKEVRTEDLSGYDVIGIGAPVWGGLPANVERFLGAIPSVTGAHAFGFCTHGAWPERFFPPLVDLLRKRGFSVIGLGDWYGSVTRPTLPKPYLTDGHPDDIDLAEARDFGRGMVELSRKILSGAAQIPILPPMVMPAASGLPKPRPKLRKEKCRYPACRLCADHCPMDGIDLSASPPVFGRHCAGCYFCEMICPEGAVEIDYEARAKASSERVEHLFLETLEKAEAGGRFRRLTPVEKVDFHKPFYKVRTTHPRYVPDDD